MAALLRHTSSEFRYRMKEGFSKQDGLLLTLLEAEIDAIKTGELTAGVFCFTDKGGEIGRP